MDKDLQNLHKSILPNWDDVEKEQQYNTAAKISHNIIKKSWESYEQYNKRQFYLEYENNEKIINAFKKIEKYGYPKRCPVIKQINNLIIF